jgi:hypothetical protein
MNAYQIGRWLAFSPSFEVITKEGDAGKDAWVFPVKILRRDKKAYNLDLQRGVIDEQDLQNENEDLS